ncbi:isoprenylcysteine carboxylmethyltransferase family protein [Chitinophagaceae bacterium LB-8]|uniref:Isoprenylcysteine carboxylmethyltransferase family protein n=1 Tax=Paraflavisolibacter caeni TaxID=2982496 RepID=A0A9X3BHH3_9BACT|nr:isoprenylcysteine carboxylmethyltransferase family protein [Paraflavisolibacter caeni]MCU7549637.1 isoprenylcysteine carboxylmethyltransferase family protein [Paraflavisolibacter caeni]
MDTKKKLTVGQIIFTVFYLLFWPALILFLSGDWFWTEGWIFGTWFLTTTIGVTVYLYIKDPALLIERYRRPGTGNQQSWDKVLMAVIMVIFLLWVVIIPLDSKRFRWTPGFPTALKYVGGVMLLLSSFFLFRAFSDNTFLSPLVRVQRERQQQLITTGVYAFVRHPMYLGALLMFLGTPLLLGSYFGIAIGVLVIFLMGLRTLGEEKMLMEEFKDYAAYKQKVRYRFIPFLW